MLKLLFALVVWFAQTAVPPVFEVASIKEARPPSSIENIQAAQFHIGMNINGSRADYGFMSLADLIPYAYRVKPYQLSGPGWMNETRWDILAKIPEGQPAARAPEMMQSLLATRFKLSTHRENREQSVYALIVGKGGLKAREVAPEEAPGAGGGLDVRINNDGSGVALSSAATGTMRLMPGPNGMQLQMAKITMAALADRLTQFLDRPVVDATGLQGNYQVTLDLSTEAMRGMAFAQKLAALAGLGSFGVPDAGNLDTSGAPIIKSLKDLGLELQSRKAPIETIIVDRVEKTPTAN
jgi:uncharacterized protein (TIGR03435 family)